MCRGPSPHCARDERVRRQQRAQEERAREDNGGASACVAARRRRTAQEEKRAGNKRDLDRAAGGEFTRSLAALALFLQTRALDRDRPRPSPAARPSAEALLSFSSLFVSSDAPREARMNWIPNPKIQSQSQSSTPVRHQFQLHQSDAHHPSSPSPLLTPRAAHQASKTNSFAASVRSVFHRSPHRAPSANSLRSAYSANSSVKPPSYSSNADNASLHPYASMVAAPLPVVSSHDASDEEEECPVCLEPLSSSFRLPGEKPHIVPECGHALHEVSACSHLRSPGPSSVSLFITLAPRAFIPSGNPWLLQRRTPSHVARSHRPQPAVVLGLERGTAPTHVTTLNDNDIWVNCAA